jgi:hypothetical protein
MKRMLLVCGVPACGFYYNIEQGKQMGMGDEILLKHIPTLTVEQKKREYKWQQRKGSV